VTREEALRSYTIEGAYATFTEKESGSIKVKNADLVVLDKDIMKVPGAGHSEGQSHHDHRRRQDCLRREEGALTRMCTSGNGTCKR